MLRFIQTKDEQMRILQACHVDATAGHMGKTRTIYKIKERFMWHGMVKDVKELVCSVDYCNISLSYALCIVSMLFLHRMSVGSLKPCVLYDNNNNVHFLFTDL